MIERVDAVAMFSDPLDDIIKRFKYDDKHGWAPILGRILLGWLEENSAPDEYDLIVPNPGFHRKHVEAIVKAAAREDLFDAWPFNVKAITKAFDTPKSAGGAWDTKRMAAEAHSAALAFDPTVVRGKRILLVDDVMTTMLTQEMVARRLRQEGALSVSGLVLARVPWG